jgi:hypothetical protein
VVLNRSRGKQRDVPGCGESDHSALRRWAAGVLAATPGVVLADRASHTYLLVAAP